ncbi:hypothetical protein R3P38DRAFT_2775708 [Favolaschia claudopus]|uniref:Uncharacterized protein n=1 Tax=Favolaschia claudopus TaxID=2862362 RepID=A0AAV9ZD89_9AGAR
MGALASHTGIIEGTRKDAFWGIWQVSNGLFKFQCFVWERILERFSKPSNLDAEPAFGSVRFGVRTFFRTELSQHYSLSPQNGALKVGKVPYIDRMDHGLYAALRRFKLEDGDDGGVCGGKTTKEFILDHMRRGSGRPSTTRFGVQFHFDSSLQRALLLELCSVVAIKLKPSPPSMQEDALAYLIQ